MVTNTIGRVQMPEVEKFHSRGAKIGTVKTKFSPTGDMTIKLAKFIECLRLLSWKWTMLVKSPESDAMMALSLGCHLALFTSSKFQQIVISNLTIP